VGRGAIGRRKIQSVGRIQQPWRCARFVVDAALRDDGFGLRVDQHDAMAIVVDTDVPASQQLREALVKRSVPAREAVCPQDVPGSVELDDPGRASRSRPGQ
jgi:hypothetical protein